MSTWHYVGDALLAGASLVPAIIATLKWVEANKRANMWEQRSMDMMRIINGLSHMERFARENARRSE